MTSNLVEDPESWNKWSPSSALMPEFKMGRDEKGRNTLIIAGRGNRYCFGRWTRSIAVEGGKTYRFRVRFRVSGIDDLNLHVLNMLVWKAADKPENQCPQDYIEELDRTNGYVIGEQVFTSPKDAKHVDLGLLLRFSAEGQVEWDMAEFLEDKDEKPNFISVVTVKAKPPIPSSPDKNLAFWEDLIDKAASHRPDLVCLPEALNEVSITDRPLYELAESIPGPTYDMLAEKAKKYRTYICGCFFWRDGDLVFNTALLLDRDGNIAGKYRKTHPYWPEELSGVSPGDEFPVFDTEIGRIGIMICYDSWFAETCRLLGLKGADIVLFPNAGYERKLLPARAIDSNVYLVVASLNSNAAIINTLGEPLVESSVDGFISARINTKERPTPHPNAGGILNASPGGRRATRNSLSSRVYEEILGEVTRRPHKASDRVI